MLARAALVETRLGVFYSAFRKNESSAVHVLTPGRGVHVCCASTHQPDAPASHCAFFEGLTAKSSWHERATLDWFEAVLQERRADAHMTRALSGLALSSA